MPKLEDCVREMATGDTEPRFNTTHTRGEGTGMEWKLLVLRLLRMCVALPMTRSSGYCFHQVEVVQRRLVNISYEVRPECKANLPDKVRQEWPVHHGLTPIALQASTLSFPAHDVICYFLIASAYLFLWLPILK